MITEKTTFTFRHTEKMKKEGTPARAPVELNVYYPTIEEILEAGGEKELALLNDTIRAVIYGQVREELENDQTNLPDTSKITWSYIASIPPGRRGGGIDKELLEEFIDDYIEVMPAITGKEVEKVKRATEVYKKRFAQFARSVDMLNVFGEQLAIYINEAPNASNYESVLTVLLKRLAELKEAATPEKLMDQF